MHGAAFLRPIKYVPVYLCRRKDSASWSLRSYILSNPERNWSNTARFMRTG